MVDLTVTQLAEELVVTGCHYQRFLTEKLQYVREMALRLEKAFLCASAAMRLGQHRMITINGGRLTILN